MFLFHLLEEKKEKFEYEGKIILLMDGLPAHSTVVEEMRDELEITGFFVFLICVDSQLDF